MTSSICHFALNAIVDDMKKSIQSIVFTLHARMHGRWTLGAKHSTVKPRNIVDILRQKLTRSEG